MEHDRGSEHMKNTIFLNAPIDMQDGPEYESALELLKARYNSDQIKADRDLFGDMKTYNKTWKEVYDPEKAGALYVLARADGTIGSGVYRQWKMLSKNYGVPATLLLLDDYDEVQEAGSFTVSPIEESERSQTYFAVVSPELVGSSHDYDAGSKA